MIGDEEVEGVFDTPPDDGDNADEAMVGRAKFWELNRRSSHKDDLLNRRVAGGI